MSIFGQKKGVPPIAAAHLQQSALNLHTYDIQFRCTTEHANVDRLSQLPLNHVAPIEHSSEPSVFNLQQIYSLPVTSARLVVATCMDQQLSRVCQYIIRGWPQKVEAQLCTYASKASELTIERGCTLWGIRVVVPQHRRERPLVKLHRDHPGTCKMKSVARSYMKWMLASRDWQRVARTAKLLKKLLLLLHCNPGNGHQECCQGSTWTLQGHSKVKCFWLLLTHFLSGHMSQ